MRLKDKSIGVPDLFRYTHAETGFVSAAPDWWTWQERIKSHRKANALAPITEAEAEDQLCQQLPPQWCKHDAAARKSRPWVNTRLRFRDIVKGTQAYIALITGGFQTVEQSEADRRARICSSCFLKVTPQGCGTCRKIATLITGDIARKRTPYDDQFKNKACGVCACPIQSVVHFPMPLLDQTDSPEKQEMFPDFCWRKVGGANRIE